MDQMGMAVDQARRDPAAVTVDDLGAVAQSLGHVDFRAGKDDAAVTSGNRAMFDNAKAGGSFSQRRQPRIAPNSCRCR
ncbi:hypothetical protein GCM10010836_46070 [Aminobacter aminovorans]